MKSFITKQIFVTYKYVLKYRLKIKIIDNKIVLLKNYKNKEYKHSFYKDTDELNLIIE